MEKILSSYNLTDADSFLEYTAFCLQNSVNIDANEGFLKSGQNPTLTVMSSGHAIQVFINGQSVGMLDNLLSFGRNISMK